MLFFGIVFVIVIAYAFLHSAHIMKKYLVTDRAKYAHQVFMSNQSYPDFYAKFGKFPTQYLNTLYIDENNNDGKIMDLSLRDFYIASAFRPYQIAGQTYDVCSYKAIQTVIEKGARFHFLDIWASNPSNPFDETAYPIVRNKTLMPGKNGQALLFDKVCEIYKKHSWNGTKYPLILYLNLQYTAQNNIFVQNKIAETLWKYFQGKFVGAKYAFGRNNIGDISIRDALSNIIILTNVYPKQGHLQELINGVISKTIQNSGQIVVYDEGNVRFGGIRAISPDMKSVINFNKTHLGIVIPGDVRDITNFYQPGNDLIQIPIDIDKSKKTCGRTGDDESYGFKDISPFNYGFNLVCINYQKPGKERDEYVDFFRNSSLVLKCDNLRHIPGPKPVINDQNKKASYAPRNMDFMGGYFSHGF
jgi:hypothetical protein